MHTVDWCRRNGRPAPCFTRSWRLTPDSPESPESERHPTEPLDLFINLTPVEQSTWARLLSGRSLSEIADEDDVSRTAIYIRIRGKGKRPGGMVAKNPWVAVWWAIRQSEPSV